MVRKTDSARYDLTPVKGRKRNNSKILSLSNTFCGLFVIIQLVNENEKHFLYVNIHKKENGPYEPRHERTCILHKRIQRR